MTRFKITAPQLGFTGKSASDVVFVESIAYLDTDTCTKAQRSALRYFRQAGYGVQEVDADNRPIFRDKDGAYQLDAEGKRIEYVDPVDDVPDPVDENVEPLPPLPADSASRPEWEDAAVLRGITAEQARAYPNKTELMTAVKAADEKLTGDKS